jgi:hypothetical protein
MPLPVTALYAAALGLIFIVLGGLTGRARGAAQVSLGDGGKPELIEAIRRHANFAEYVPLILVLFAIIELNGAPKSWLHGLGSVLVVSRLLHPFGLHYDRMNSFGRIVGTAGTYLVTLAASLIAGWQALR